MDWPAWLSAVGTVGTFIVALVNRRRDAEMAQARLVAAWVADIAERKHEDPSAFYAVTVRASNGSRSTTSRSRRTSASGAATSATRMCSDRARPESLRSPLPASHAGNPWRWRNATACCWRTKARSCWRTAAGSSCWRTSSRPFRSRSWTRAGVGGSVERTASCADSSELDRHQWQSCADQGVPPRLAHDVPRQRSTAGDLRALDREPARASGVHLREVLG